MLGQVLVKIKKSNQLFTQSMIKELFVSIFEKYLKEIETMTRKIF